MIGPASKYYEADEENKKVWKRAAEPMTKDEMDAILSTMIGDSLKYRSTNTTTVAAPPEENREVANYCFMASVFDWEGSNGKVTIAKIREYSVTADVREWKRIGIMSDDTRQLKYFDKVIIRTPDQLMFVCEDDPQFSVIIDKAGDAWMPVRYDPEDFMLNVKSKDSLSYFAKMSKD